MGVDTSSHVLAQLTVRRHLPRALDLGAGCGILALLAAQHCERVTATDLNPRAVQTAEFNTQLNGVSNIEFLTGDLFEPVRGHDFDLIVCNPHFVIAPGQGWMHTYGGRPADGLCWDIVRSAPALLREGGFFQLVGNWVQVAGRNWRDRLYELFADTGCDAWVLHSHTEDASDYALQRIAESGHDVADAVRQFDEWMAYYERQHIEAIAFAAITLRRASGKSNWIRFDRIGELAKQSGTAIEQGFALRDFLETHRADDELLAARLRPTANMCWEQRRELTAAGWTTVESRVRTMQALGFVANLDPEVAEFVARCRADRPLSAQLAELAAAARQPADRIAPSFLTVVRRLVELGCLLPVT